MNRRSFLRSAIAAALAPVVRPLYRLVAPLPSAIVLFEAGGQRHFPVFESSGSILARARVFPFYRDKDSLVVFGYEYSSLADNEIGMPKSRYERQVDHERIAVQDFIGALQRPGEIADSVHGEMPQPGQILRLKV